MSHRVQRALAAAILYGGTAGVLVFFYTPIVTLMAFSIREGRFLTLPFDGVSLKWYAALFSSAKFLTALSNTALAAVVVTAVAAAIATGAALAWVRFRFRFKRLYQAVTAAPLLFPQLLLGIVLLLWFSVLGRWFAFTPSLVTAIIGHVVYLTPFAMIILCVQVHNLDESLDEAARDCGASTLQVYREVTLPLMWPGIFAAGVFVFLLSWGNFYITYSLAGTAKMLPTYIYSGISMGGSSPIYPALATVVFVPGLALVVFAERYRRRAMRR